MTKISRKRKSSDVCGSKLLKYKNVVFKFGLEATRQYEFFETNPRYGFKLRNVDEEKKNSFDGIQLIDYFHGKTRNLSLSNGPLKFEEDENFIDVQSIDDSHLLVYKRKRSDFYFSFIFQIVKLNLSDDSCKLMEEKIGSTYEYPPVLAETKHVLLADQIDPTKFVIANTYSQSDQLCLLFGDLANQKFFTHYEEIPIVGHSYNYLDCCQLKKNQLIGLKFDQDVDTQGIKYWNINLDDKEFDGLNVEFEFDLNESMRLKNLEFKCHSWTDEMCYVHFKDKSCIYRNNLYAFNILTRKCTLLSFARGFQLDDMYLDNDGYLVCKEQNGVYRFGLNKPEKLENIAWFDIRQHNKTGIYEKAMEILPLNSDLQPFYEKM